MKREEIIPQQTKTFIKENIKEINNKEFNNLFQENDLIMSIYICTLTTIP